MKLTMVGKSGSGKTTYMAALHEVLGVSRVNGFYITPSAATWDGAVAALGKFEQLSFSSNGFQFPAGTQKTTLWSFDMFYGTQLVSDFQWIDYRGGILDDIYAADLDVDTDKKQYVDELLGHIALSNAVLLFADSVMLTRYGTNGERQLHSGARVINSLVRLFAAYYANSNLTLLIVLTKADSDLIAPIWKQNNYEKLAQVGCEAFNEVVSLVKFNKPRWTGGIVAVGSVGEGRVRSAEIGPRVFPKPLVIQTEIIDYPTPINAYHPLFYTIGSTLLRMEKAATANVTSYSRQIEAALQKSSLLMDFWSFVTGAGNPRDIAVALQAKRMQELHNLQKIQPHILPLYRGALQKVREI